MTPSTKRPLVFAVSLKAADSAEGRADMARMLRNTAVAMTKLAGELEDRAIRQIGDAVRGAPP